MNRLRKNHQTPAPALPSTSSNPSPADVLVNLAASARITQSKIGMISVYQNITLAAIGIRLLNMVRSTLVSPQQTLILTPITDLQGFLDLPEPSTFQDDETHKRLVAGGLTDEQIQDMETSIPGGYGRALTYALCSTPEVLLAAAQLHLRAYPKQEMLGVRYFLHAKHNSR